jgi:hypothetical protein
MAIDLSQLWAAVGGSASPIGQFVQNPGLGPLARDVLLPWVLQLAPSIPSQWFEPHNLVQCEGGTGISCANRAMAPCAICGRYTCLHHSFLGSDASLVCHSCLWIAKQAVEEDQKRRRRDPTEARTKAKAENPRPPPGPGVHKAKDLSWAWDTLGLKPGSTHAEIREKYRLLLVKYHPDKARSEAAKARAHERYVAVRSAYDALAAELKL